MPRRVFLPSCFDLHRLLGMAVLVVAFCTAGRAQEGPGPDPAPPAPGPEAPNETGEPPAPPQFANVTRTTVHGVVKSASTGQPLSRALVRIEGDAASGALTDGDGRFEIPNVPIGPQAFQVMKPGFVDAASAGVAIGGPVINGASNSEHNVYVVADMPEVSFSLAPTNAIQGNVELSTGDPGQNIAVMLLRRAVQDGRVIWQPVTNVRTNSEGAYRFAGLTDGAYALFTEPTMDSEFPSPFVGADSQQAATRAGYRTLFYPDATDLASASKIKVAGGEQTQANLLLTEEPFHMVRAIVTTPNGNPSPNVNVMILDGQGHQLPYSGQYDPGTRSIQTFLPDGTYAMQVTAVDAPQNVRVADGRTVNIISGRSEGERLERIPAHGPLIGRVEFSVAGRPVTHLQVPLTSQRSNTIQVSLIRSGTPQQTANGAFSSSVANDNQHDPPLVIMLSQAGGSINDGMVTSFAEGYATGPIETSPDMGPGAYWVHTNLPSKALCEASFTAGGASLAREPLQLSLSGASAPLSLTLRDDCAALKIALPNEADIEPAGDEPYYTVYVVPDFDSTTDITPVVLRPSSGGSITLQGLTPGSYHVYTFDSQVQLEYHNPEAMAAVASHAQPITLDPGMTGSLVLEAPRH